MPDAVFCPAATTPRNRLPSRVMSLFRSNCGPRSTKSLGTGTGLPKVNVGRVVTRQTLIEQLWGAEREVEGNTLDAFVKSLRHKIDAGDRPRLIHTVRGVGYTLRAKAES